MGLLQESPIPETYAGAKPWWAGRSDAPNFTELAEGQRLTGAEMQVAAGLDWTVRTEPTFFARRVGQTEDGFITQMAEVPGDRAIIRDGDEKVLGSATHRYHPIQNSVLFEATDTALSMSDAHYVTAGSLYGGKVVWTLAQVDRELYVRGDGSPYLDYIMGYAGHDGRHALGFGPTTIRVVCGNTAQMAIEGMTGKFIVRHTASAEARIADIKKALDVRNKYVDTYIEAMNELTRRPMTVGEVEKFVEALWPIDPEVKNPFKTLQQREGVVNLFKGSETLDGVDETAYRTLQSVVEYLDQYKAYGSNGGAADRKAMAIFEGSAFTTKSRALALLQKA